MTLPVTLVQGAYIVAGLSFILALAGLSQARAPPAPATGSASSAWPSPWSRPSWPRPAG